MGTDRFNLHAELTVRVGDEMFANARRIELLRQIDQLGNLTQAAKQVGYSYKGAWDAIDDMARLSGGTLIERHAGGKGGGGTHLTERGQQVLRNFSLIQAEHARFIARLDALANGLSNDYAMQNEIAVRTSARNQFAAILVSITPGAVNDELGLLINGSQMLVASITHESCRELQLAVGAKVFALIKAKS
jgi:molybdate transport system regulatory protein